ncbi:hypothetical protein C942_04516 [Photobacterium marinum]|uniref:Uncharacterized protein n=1 Tax=Photobacterium marinum TaxID=1056511 RepID=L8JHB5_9GAMM|nr:hypothetical protein [Photobacterium marinum]ELR66817.1 hypothetical protein C942_04516 [Photobacterium marinum]
MSEFNFNDDVEYVRSLPDAFDCSDLYNSQPVICFDQRKDFNVTDGMVAVFVPGDKAKHAVFTAPLTQTNYNAILAGLRRQGMVFAHLNVSGEALDVLAGIRTLDRQTLDDQMFALVNRYDFLVRREYLFMDKSAFQRAYQLGYRNIEHWLSADLSKDPQQRAEERVVTMTVYDDQITLNFAFPFAGGKTSSP